MPRNISFFHTQDQIRDRSKTVTRRTGWKFLKSGAILNACEKCQGLKKGKTVTRICQIRVISVRQERLNAITAKDCQREGFPDMTPAQFIEFFCEAMGCKPDQIVTRIEFEYI